MEETELCFPQLNSSCSRVVRPYALTIFLYILLCTINLLTVFLNLLVIISISHYKQLHSPTNLLVLALAVSDFLVAPIMFFQVLLINGCWLLSDLMCSLYTVMDYIITSTSIGIMVLISIDRYVAICDPLHYPTKVTQKRVQVCVFLCWILSALCHILMMKDNLVYPGKYTSCIGECVVVIEYVAGRVDLFLSFIGPITVIIVLYMRVFVVAVSQARAMRSQTVTVTAQGSMGLRAKKSELKAARTLGVVIFMFLICLCPYFCVTLTSQDTLINEYQAAPVLWLFYFNSCLNPIIYIFFYPWFRKCIKLIFTLEILRPGSCDTNVL
ncbi:trace amine-associated receptor 4-like [Mastacembelus armatus]|uniref:trace amine-associated receptor 4-like n=1 Tax=Mastacembelus armatus TaxID=205130 RepID=UPI000E465D48|nr:trace amine-associated receptor 4-like [Mastacembelus armatus]